MQGYDAQVNYSVNYQDLPEYLDTDLLDEAHKLPLYRGQEMILEWMRRVDHGIKAAIRRKQFRKV